MRMSCNGCRVLRKGCSEDCIIRPCLDWIKNPDSQANATVLLAKFYGRAGLLNLLTAVPHHQRPSVFRSLLYESCGRMVNPISGSVGLQWNGKWHLCQAAVDAVLQGKPIVPISSSSGPTPSSNSFVDTKQTINMVSKCSNGTMEESQLIDLKLSLSSSLLAESGGMDDLAGDMIP